MSSENDSSTIKANWMLVCMGVPVILDGLEDFVPTLWVALFEGLFETRIPGIIREPTTFEVTRHHRIHNISLVLKELSDVVLSGMDLSHLSAKALMDRDPYQIANLVDIFFELTKQLFPAVSPPVFTLKDIEAVNEADTVAPLSVIAEGKTPNASFQFSNLSPVRQTPQEKADQPSSLEGEMTSVILPSIQQQPSVSEIIGDSRSFSRWNRTNSSKSHTGYLRESDDLEQYLKNQRTKKHNHELSVQDEWNDEDKREVPEYLDTPYTKVLKMRKAQLMRDLKVAEDRVSLFAKADDMRLVAECFADPSLSPTAATRAKGKARVPPPPPHPAPAARRTLKRKASTHPTPFGSSIRPRAFKKRARAPIASGTMSTVESIPEYNLQLLEDRISNTMPTSRGPPIGLKNVVWNSQVAMWNRALKDRLHARQVHRKPMLDAQHAAVRGLASIQHEISRHINTESEARSRNALIEAKHDLNERERRVVRMLHRQETVEDEMSRVQTHRQLSEENLFSGIYKKFLDEQRRALLEERRSASKISEQQRKVLQQMQESKENYYRDQVAMYQEKLKAFQAEEKIIEKAQAQTIRDLARESKQRARASLQQLYEKLDEDARSNYQKLDKEVLEKAIEFKPIRKR